MEERQKIDDEVNDYPSVLLFGLNQSQGNDVSMLKGPGGANGAMRGTVLQIGWTHLAAAAMQPTFSGVPPQQ